MFSSRLRQEAVVLFEHLARRVDSTDFDLLTDDIRSLLTYSPSQEDEEKKKEEKPAS